MTYEVRRVGIEPTTYRHSSLPDGAETVAPAALPSENPAATDATTASFQRRNRNATAIRGTASKRHPLYATWSGMVARCHNPRHPNYPTYGGRGITVCDRWRASLDAFAADMGPRPAGHTVDRIDNDGPYDPANCRWASRLEQGHNRRDVRPLTWNGRTQPLSAWAREAGLPAATIRSRLERGESLGSAMARPADQRFNPNRQKAS